MAILSLPDRERYGIFRTFSVESPIFKDSYSAEDKTKYATINDLVYLQTNAAIKSVSEKLNLG